MITFKTIKKIAEKLPGSVESTSYGTPAIKVGKKLVLRLHQKEDAIVLLLNTVEKQQQLIESDPMTFYITDHYSGYPAILVRPTISEEEFTNLVEIAWRRVANKKQIAQYENTN